MKYTKRILLSLTTAFLSVLVIACGVDKGDPKSVSEDYVENLIDDTNYNLEVSDSTVRYYGKVADAKELYGDKVENKDSISSFCVVKVEIKSHSDKESYYEIDCVEYNGEWKAMGEHSKFYEYTDGVEYRTNGDGNVETQNVPEDLETTK